MLRKDLVIYLDMDGVVADFGAQKNAVERYENEKGFFKNLKPITKNVLAVKDLHAKGYKIVVLTTSPNNRADRDKKFWLREHLPMLNEIIFARPNIAKIDYVDNKENAVLIDDYGKNIREWFAGGGLHAVKITPRPKEIEIDYLEIGHFVRVLESL